MAQKRYHGADATVTMTVDGGTSIAVGELRGLTITPNVEVDELYSADSIKRSAVKQRNFSVNVDATHAAFDVTLIKEWLGGDGAASDTMADTSTPALFEVTGAVTPEGGGTDLQGVVTDVYFPEMPVFSGLSHDAWMEHNITGTGKDLTVTGDETA